MTVQLDFAGKLGARPQPPSSSPPPVHAPPPLSSSSPVLHDAVAFTVFLNFVFANVGVRLWLFCTLPLYALLLGGVVAVVTVFFNVRYLFFTTHFHRQVFALKSGGIRSVS